MTTTTIIAVLCAAFLHAFWNFLVRSTQDKALGMAAVVFGHLPLSVIGILWAGLPPASVWPYLIAAAVLHLGYQVFLLNAYRFGELTQIYPIARGAAPLFIAVAGLFFIDEALNAQELCGIGLISGGILIYGIWQFRHHRQNVLAIVLALITSGFIASYSLVDGLGTREWGSPVGYYSLLTLCNTLLFAPYLRLVHPGVLSQVLTTGRRTFLTGGSASYLAYALVLWACLSARLRWCRRCVRPQYYSPLSLGHRLKERPTSAKVLMALMIFIGVLLLRLA